MNEKEVNYFKRTFEHIHRVQNNMKLLITTYHDQLNLRPGDCRVLAYNVMNHDRSKFSRKQFGAYIELNEYYRIRRSSNPDHQYHSEEIKKAVDVAVQDHYEQENHHAESNAFNVDYMSCFDLIEVCCDLQAMAQEFNEGSCRIFWENKWLPKYKISNSSKSLMDRVIQCFEKEIKTNS
jgi:hypothetical protein